MKSQITIGKLKRNIELINKTIYLNRYNPRVVAEHERDKRRIQRRILRMQEAIEIEERIDQIRQDVIRENLSKGRISDYEVKYIKEELIENERKITELIEEESEEDDKEGYKDTLRQILQKTLGAILDIEEKKEYYELDYPHYMREEEHGTIFFVTINSNRVLGNPFSVNIENGYAAIDELRNAFKYGAYIDHDNSNLDVVGDINRVVIEGKPEIGPKMKRLHFHLVITIEHKSKSGGEGNRYLLSIDDIRQVFSYHWNVSTYVNIKAGKYTERNKRNMLNYLDKYITNVSYNPRAEAPYAFFG